MANDETGISMDPEFRLGIARKIVQRAADYGIPPEDIVIDPLALTVAADPQAVQVTLQTMRMIRDELGVNMVCGAGNISFGLPERPPLTGAYLAMAMTHGLTCAITDATNPVINQMVKAADVLLGHDEYAVNWIAEFRQKKKAEATS
jgi:5-methyltetrahydrofolate--homocysteine methyltransferase